MDRLSLLLLLSLVPLGSAEHLQNNETLDQANSSPDSPPDLQDLLRDLSVKLAENRLMIQQLQKENSDQALKLDRNEAVILKLWKKQGCWTEWFNRDNPHGTGDWELLSFLRSENPGKICDWPTGIEAETLSGLSPAFTGDVVKMNTVEGFSCSSDDQKGGRMCNDYRVRFRCPFSFCENKGANGTPQTTTPGANQTTSLPGCWTAWFDLDDPSGYGDFELLAEHQLVNPGKICDLPTDIEAETLSGLSAAATGDVVTIDKATNFVCRNQDQNGTMCNDYRVRFRCSSPFCADEGANGTSQTTTPAPPVGPLQCYSCDIKNNTIGNETCLPNHTCFHLNLPLGLRVCGCISEDRCSGSTSCCNSSYCNDPRTTTAPPTDHHQPPTDHHQPPTDHHRLHVPQPGP